MDLVGLPLRVRSPFLNPLDFSVLSGRMCWLCHGYAETYRYAPTSILDVTLQWIADEQDMTATVSKVTAGPRWNLFWYHQAQLMLPLSFQQSSPERHLAGFPLYDKKTNTWTFQVHADCWDLVACRVSDPLAVATAWCKYLISTSPDIEYHPPGFDAPSKHEPSPRPWSAIMTYGWPDQRASMRRLYSFDGLAAELGFDRLPTAHAPMPLDDLDLTHSASTPTLTGHGKRNNPFSKLPVELLEQIIGYPPTADLLALRLASRTIACVSLLPKLPRSFWRSRFTGPVELGFALPE
ncbi:hypothetical protein N657DRAFT_640745 [Parathielavia appendiculata]|uniref:F-box domain-containing protein n=1 Tax=Parathielavia appendiculata TaxID=2587402 RepID=A0AAN6Z5V8_9PEZI|nr:hypothetical protein N657DRAFT_640745 [Parathielavia appendiculata]